MAGLVGIAALGRLLSRRSAPAAVTEPALAADPAEELRQRLAAQRTGDGESPAEASETSGETLEERRARIHEQAQRAIDAMREPGA
jgi:hypothetical protein